MKLSIITLTYNKLEYTKKFIESLFSFTKDFELIIVDNGSTDGTREYLQTLEGVKLILNDSNLGFSKGNNQGLEIASGEYIGFLNNDILLYPNWFEECKKVFINENAAFVSPTQITPLFENVCEKNYIDYFENLKKEGHRKTFDECQFACVITRKDVIQKIGGFDEKFTPAFWEDNDLKYRAIEQGYDTYVVNNVCFFHYSSVTSAKINHNFEKNREYYYKKHRFAKYLSIYADENNKFKDELRFYDSVFLKNFYKIELLMQKIKRNLKRFFRG